MVSSDQFPVPDIEYLYDGVCSVQCKCQDITVLAVFIFHLLLLHDAQNILLQIPELCCGLIVHRLTCGCHLLLQEFDDFPVIAVQKIHSLADAVPVLLRTDKTLAGCFALSDLVIQAGAFSTDVPREIPAAVPDLVELAEKFDRLLYGKSALERTIITGSVLLHFPGEKYPGIFFLQRDFNVRIGLVILEKRVVLGTMLLDQVIFKNQCLQLGVCHYIFEISDPADHVLDLGTPAQFFYEILVHASLQIHCLTDIQDRVRPVVHDIHARSVRQFFQFFLKVKIRVHSFPSATCTSRLRRSVALCSFRVKECTEAFVSVHRK